jgi:hypothetical protein
VAVVVCIAILLVGVLVWRRWAGAPEASESDAADPETELLSLCLGDRSQMERLIALETKKSPGITRSVAMARAAYSIRRDKR